MEARFPIKEGCCPMCDSRDTHLLEREVHGEQVEYQTRCGQCGFEFQQWYEMEFTDMTAYGPDEDHIDITPPEEKPFCVSRTLLEDEPERFWDALVGSFGLPENATVISFCARLDVCETKDEQEKLVKQATKADAENTSMENLEAADGILERTLNEPASTIGLNFVKGQHHTVNLVDDGTMDTVIEIGGREFRFDCEHASGYRMEDGAMTARGLADLGSEALIDLEESELEELADEKKEG